ncbi:MAG TPA: T9SS type A sorting domain-containing protein, partial [Candidatus Kapabacteria bacterium]|nr:T9SS type A sorting domain-containing protein [Candidatus Kapabacteria bacterium]
TDDGLNWIELKKGLTEKLIYAFTSNETTLFVGTDNGLFVSTDNGENWEPRNTGFSVTTIFSLAANDAFVFLGTADGFYKSSDNGQNWLPSITNITTTIVQVRSILTNNNVVLTVTDHGNYRSNDGGINWKVINWPQYIISLGASGDSVFAGTYNHIYLSTDNGASWSDSAIGAFKNEVLAICCDKNNLYVGTFGSGIFTHKGNEWRAVNNDLISAYGTSLIEKDNTIFAGIYGGVFQSVDAGNSWISMDSGLTNTRVMALIEAENRLYAGTMGSGAIFSSDDGMHWAATPIELQYMTITSFVAIGEHVFVGTESNGVYRTTDKGESWSPVNTDLNINTRINGFAASNNDLYTCTSSGIFQSTNEGTTWNKLGGGVTGINCLGTYAGIVFAGTMNGMFSTSDRGNSWTIVDDIKNTAVTAIYVSDTMVFALLSGSRIMVSIDRGNSWHEVSTIGNGVIISSLLVRNGDLYAATAGDGVWKRSLSALGVSTENLHQSFSLDQNTPNPTSNSTSISFTITSRSFFSLKVFDELGKVVAVLASEELPAGSYTRNLNTADLTNGNYTYELRTAEGSQTKKLVVQK